MKKIIFIICSLVFAITLFAQSPEKMSYQAVVRDATGQLITNSEVGVRISILQGSSSGSAVYIETQNPTANANGLVSLEIGEGTIVSGDFATIDWGSNSYYLKTETDPNGGFNYTIAGTSQLLSVPYALYAKSSGSGDWTQTGNNIYSANSGNVGIGTSVPISKLQISGTNNSIRIVGTLGNYNHGGTLKFGDAENATIQEDVDDKLKVTANRVWLKADVGIGLEVPEQIAKLDVRGNAKAIRGQVDATGVNVNEGVFGFVQGGEGTNWGVFGDAGAGVVNVGVLGTGSGNLGAIGVRGFGQGTGSYGVFGESNGALSWAGYFDGNLGYTGDLLGPSDAKLKKEVQVLTGALEKVLQLQPKTYFFKTDEYDHMNLATGPQMGFIAQEVQEIFPEVVKENVVYFPGEDAEKHEMIKTEYIGINYLSFVPILTKAIQEQQEEIESLRNENEALKARMDRMETMLEGMNK
ncbi:MAG: tail fiber domain-containing protein [Saprospiraceae bacterium]|nr:tail fiber domain-containing protein [Saprospiraceae bacterium]MCB9325395.1 tail fiber domain-containing protein [Lewinellaceae bacterium]